MNHITQRNRLETQLKLYIKFMKICPESSVIKLAKEITNIENRLDKLREYDIPQLMKPVVFQYSTKQSKMNKF